MGDFEWCRDFANISGQGNTDVYQQDLLVEKMTRYAFVCAALGVLIDIVDVVSFCACPDAVVFKSVVNICSACIMFQVASAVMSLILAPMSAYYGGKLIGVPYV